MINLDRFSSSTTKVMVNEATLFGIKVEVISYKYNLIKLSHNSISHYLMSSSLPINSMVAMSLADNKYLTKKVLEKYDIPVTKYYCAKTRKKTLNTILKHNFFPCVIKPILGAHGNNVYVNIENKKELEGVLKIIFKNGKQQEILIEEFIKGIDYRVYVLNGKVIAAMQRIPAHVIGNGKYTIKQLVKKHNLNPMIGIGYEKPYLKIKIDDEVIRILKKQKLTPDFIPASNQTIFLRENANISTGGIGKDATDTISEEIKNISEKSAKISGLRAVGVDIIENQMTKKPYLIELNASAGFDIHHFPLIGRQRKVALEILKTLFAENLYIPQYQTTFR